MWFGPDTGFLNVSPGSVERAMSWTPDRNGEDTSPVTVKEPGKKNTGCGCLPVIGFPKLVYTGSARGHSGQWDGYSVSLVGDTRLI